MILAKSDYAIARGDWYLHLSVTSSFSHFSKNELMMSRRTSLVTNGSSGSSFFCVGWKGPAEACMFFASVCSIMRVRTAATEISANREAWSPPMPCERMKSLQVRNKTVTESCLSAASSSGICSSSLVCHRYCMGCTGRILKASSHNKS